VLVVTTVVHYEALCALSSSLVAFRIAPRAKLVAVIPAAFFVHALEMFLYGVARPGAARRGRRDTQRPAADRVVGVLHLSRHGELLAAGRATAVT